MRQALLLVLALWAALHFTVDVLEVHLAVSIGFAAIALIAAANAVTFLWLWYVRATPLALGMALSWAGQAALSAWWFTTGMAENGARLHHGPLVFLFIAMYLSGGLLHLAVIQNSAGSARTAAIWPAMAVLAVAAGVFLGP